MTFLDVDVNRSDFRTGVFEHLGSHAEWKNGLVVSVGTLMEVVRENRLEGIIANGQAVRPVRAARATGLNGGRIAAGVRDRRIRNRFGHVRFAFGRLLRRS
jgi:hypothetical protein